MLLTSRQDDIVLERIPENDRAAKINDLHDTMLIDHYIVQLQISMRKTHAVEILHTRHDLQRAATYLLPAHLASHDDREEVERCVLHDFVPLALLLNDIHRLDDVTVVERGADTEFGRDLLVVFSLRLVRMPVSELLHRKGYTITGPLHESD